MARVRLPAEGKVVSRDRRRSRLTADESKKTILAMLRTGYTVTEACQAVGKVRKTYEYYRSKDSEFRAKADAALAAIQAQKAGNRKEVPDFPEFSEKYLGNQLFWHHRQWFDLLEGREPQDLHPRQIFEPHDPDMLLINTPPEGSKTTTFTVGYTVWRIVQDPNVRVVIVSKTQEMARKMLLAIKERLAESDQFVDLQQDFGPPGGFAGEGSAAWTADKIYVNGRSSDQKDPTVWALGLRGHIYGARADLVIMDDCVDHTNHGDYVKQIDWIQNQVQSRVADVGGKMVLIGTRLESQDLYSEIRKPEYYNEGRSPWTYLTQPAVLEYADDPKDWVTFWPKTNRAPVTLQARRLVQADESGLWPMWDGPALARKRAKMTPRNWSMVYMQDQVSDDSVFKVAAVTGCIDRARYPGRLMPGQSQHRKHGMEGLTVVAGLDPAAAGFTAMQVWGLDRRDGRRWVLDVVNKRALPPHEMRAEMFRLTERYGIQEWRVEKNAYQASIVQDREIRQKLAAYGCLISPHHTNANKWDADFGVASMATLFEGWDTGDNLIRLPSQTQSEHVRAFVEQLCAWFPETKGLTDTVMAAWFVEIRCRELMATQGQDFHMENEFLSAREIEDQVTLDLDYILVQGGATGWNGRWN